jgi:hypothetical protein
VTGGPWRSAYNPLIQLDVQTIHGILALPVQTVHATDTESAIRAGYLSNLGHPVYRRS